MTQKQQLRSAAEQIAVMEGFGGVYKKPRTFVRGMDSHSYNLNERRAQHRAEVTRVFTPKARHGPEGEAQVRIIEPDDEPFRTQSLLVHFVAIAPGSRNEGHGHQNEAMFYVLQGHGWEEHDGKEYPWTAGDIVAVHNDCVHWHCNGSQTDWGVSIVYKAKPMWLFLGLGQQGEVGYRQPEGAKLGPRVEWAVARRPEDLDLKKVMKPGDTPWQWTPHGYVRKVAGAGVPLRIKATTAFMQEVPAGSRTGKRWQMADEFVYFLEGSGYSLHWDVAAEIEDEYYARIALDPIRLEWKAGDFMWVPQNTVFQHFNTDPTTPTRFLTAHNTVFDWLGYREVDMEPCPEWAQKNS